MSAIEEQSQNFVFRYTLKSIKSHSSIQDNLQRVQLT